MWWCEEKENDSDSYSYWLRQTSNTKRAYITCIYYKKAISVPKWFVSRGDIWTRIFIYFFDNREVLRKKVVTREGIIDMTVRNLIFDITELS